MKKFDKAILLLIGVGILFNILKENFYKKKTKEIVIAGHSVDMRPCISAINELFGKGVNSAETCNCLLPKFYPLIKDDPEKVKKFEEVGFFTLQNEAKDSAARIFRACILNNVIDTAYKLDLEKFREPFLQKLKDTLRILPGLSNVNIDSLGNCILKRFDGNVTIREYFAEDYLKVEKLKNILQKCIVEFSKKK